MKPPAYEEMLDRALSKTSVRKAQSRLEVPLVISNTEGMKTIISNLDKIAQVLMRDQKHILKYIVKRLATSGFPVGEKIFLKGKFQRGQLNSIIREYMDEYVMCPVCKTPDTSLVKEKGISYLVCSSCGAREAVRKI
jgi:translation initiation factor 2 subunit 2